MQLKQHQEDNPADISSAVAHQPQHEHSDEHRRFHYYPPRLVADGGTPALVIEFAIACIDKIQRDKHHERNGTHHYKKNIEAMLRKFHNSANIAIFYNFVLVFALGDSGFHARGNCMCIMIGLMLSILTVAASTAVNPKDSILIDADTVYRYELDESLLSVSRPSPVRGALNLITVYDRKFGMATPVQ